MADIIFVAIVIGFFMLCVMYVGLCDRIIGTEDPPAAAADTEFVSPADPAHADSARSGPDLTEVSA